MEFFLIFFFLISAIIRCFFEVPFALLPWIGIVEFLQGLLPNFVYEILPISAKVFVFFFSETLTTEIPAGHILECLYGFHPQFLNKLVQNLYQRFFLKFFWHFYYFFSRDFWWHFFEHSSWYSCRDFYCSYYRFFFLKFLQEHLIEFFKWFGRYYVVFWNAGCF